MLTPSLPGLGPIPDDRCLPSADPLEVAQWLARHAFTSPTGDLALVFRRGSFFLHNGTSWYEPSHDTIRARAYHALAGAYTVAVRARSTDHISFAPNKTKIDHVLDALEAVVSIPEHIDLPAFITPHPNDPSSRSGLLVFPNLTFDCGALPTLPPPTDSGTVIDLTAHGTPTTPRLLTLSGLSVPYDPTAQCPRWLRALSEWGNNDPTWSLSVERMLAYALLPIRRYAKWFLLEGHSRAGKGTVLTVLRHLVGPTAFFSTDFDRMASNFGLDGIQHASILAIPEVPSNPPFQQRDRVATVLKLCLGEDPLHIDVKYTRPLRNVMPAVVPIIASNGIPALANRSAGLSSKMVPIPFDVSFRGREDPYLKDTLLTELPGIAARLLQHAAALLQAGHQPFTLSDRARARLHSFNLANNAAEAFLTARFVPSPEGRVSYEVLRRYFEHWKTVNRVRLPHIAHNVFGRWLIENSTWDGLRPGDWRAAVGSTDRVHGLIGLAIRPDAQDIITNATTPEPAPAR